MERILESQNILRYIIYDESYRREIFIINNYLLIDSLNQRPADILSIPIYI